MWRWSFSGVRELRDDSSNPSLLSTWETGVNPGIRSWKKRWYEWAWCQKAIGGIYITKRWRTETLQPGLEFDDFKPRLESGIFKCIFWLNRSFFGDGDQGFLKEVVKAYLMAPMSPLNSSIFLCVHIYSLWFMIPDFFFSSARDCRHGQQQWRTRQGRRVGELFLQRDRLPAAVYQVEAGGWQAVEAWRIYGFVLEYIASISSLRTMSLILFFCHHYRAHKALRKEVKLNWSQAARERGRSESLYSSNFRKWYRFH
jgi:hypothetical protein